MSVLRVVGWHFPSFFKFCRTYCKHTVETQIRHHIMSDLDLHCLPTSHKKDPQHVFIERKEKQFFYCTLLSRVRTLVKSAQRKTILFISQPKNMLWVLNVKVLLSTQNIC